MRFAELVRGLLVGQSTEQLEERIEYVEAAVEVLDARVETLEERATHEDSSGDLRES
jgi:hypothetical protein